MLKIDSVNAMLSFALLIANSVWVDLVDKLDPIETIGEVLVDQLAEIDGLNGLIAWKVEVPHKMRNEDGPSIGVWLIELAVLTYDVESSAGIEIEDVLTEILDLGGLSGWIVIALLINA